MLKQKGDFENLKTFMNKIYTEESVAQERIDLIEINDNKENGDDSGPTYGALCCGK